MTLLDINIGICKKEMRKCIVDSSHMYTVPTTILGLETVLKDLHFMWLINPISNVHYVLVPEYSTVCC